jgi:nucleotide-binding universal stress UspA family protein
MSGATVEVVQVALPVVSAMGLGEVPVLMPSEDPRPYLERERGRLEAVGVPARAVALEGRAAPELLRHLREGGAALVCMTTHGRSGLPRLLLGSIAEELLRHASCPVWIRRTVRSEG